MTNKPQYKIGNEPIEILFDSGEQVMVKNKEGLTWLANPATIEIIKE